MVIQSLINAYYYGQSLNSVSPPPVYSGKAYHSTTVGLVKSTHLIFMWNSWMKANGIKRACLSKEENRQV